MGVRSKSLDEKQISFIQEQKVYFVATAAAQGRVNLSPKGMDSLRVLGKNRIIWLNLTGSGNETAAHLLENPRMTVMWCSFGQLPSALLMANIVITEMSLSADSACFGLIST